MLFVDGGADEGGHGDDNFLYTLRLDFQGGMRLKIFLNMVL